jgi:hypothetical protein
VARQRTVEAIDTLVAIMRDERQDARARVLAANAVLDRAWGKPAPEPTEPDPTGGYAGEEIVVVTHACCTCGRAGRPAPEPPAH